MMQPTFKDFSLYTLLADSSSYVVINKNTDQEFHSTEFSRFKYGQGKIARQYAEQLANGLIANQFIHKDKIYFLCGSAYATVPTAANAISDFLVNILQEKNYTVHHFKITSKTFQQDYSSLNEKERKRLLCTLDPTIEETTTSLIQHSNVIVVDDIKITGLHQQAIERLNCGANILFCYVATVQQNAVQKNCNIEWQLNHVYVNNISKLTTIITEPDFIPNSRVCKYILSQPIDQIQQFISIIERDKLKQLIQLIKLDKYHTISAYKQAFKLLNTLDH